MSAPPAAALRIALACDWFLPRLGGIELHLRDLALGLRSAGHDVQVVTPTPGPDDVDGIPVRRVSAPLFPGFGFVWTPAAFRTIAGVLRAERFDVVHAHASIVSPTAYGAAVAARRAGIPAVVTFHSVLRNHAYWLRPAMRALGLPARGLTFTAVSGVVAREAAALLGGAEVAVLSNAIDAATWRVTPAARDGDTVRIVAVMRLEPKKRPRALVRMIARLRDVLAGNAKRSPRLRVHIVGDGSELAPLRKLVDRLGLSEVIELAGRLERSEIRALFARADFFVLPTILEAFGIAALEARAAGLPVVVRREAGIAELLTNGVDGLLAASDEEMVDAMRRLVADAPFRERIADHNRDVLPAARWSDVLGWHVALYDQVRARLRPTARESAAPTG